MSDDNNKRSSLAGTILAIVVLLAGLGVYALTGEDLLGVLSEPEPQPIEVTLPATLQEIPLENGYGYAKDFWQVFFTIPIDTRDRSQWQNGIDEQLAASIDNVQSTLDIAAFELNSEAITQAIIRAHERGVTVRIVTDDEHGIEDDDSTIIELEAYEIPIVDDDRSGLMHNKFMIMDGIIVWTGSMNYTQNGVFRNNNNLMSMRSRRAVEAYQAEFDEMFERGEFGITSSDDNFADFRQDGVGIEIYFASEGPVIDEILAEITDADSTIHFMVFSFTRDDLGQALLDAAERGVTVEGVFETTGSETRFSEMSRLFCAGLDVRQDGNPGILHHKVFIIDDDTVVTGSFNFSNNAVESNDENLVIIQEPDIAALFLQEFERMQQISSVPGDDDVTCN
jgi:phosphatidylserine/phosphatidylglycerophosphate/cardiolipin synthase-like enzyme